ncbi:hypothetical protein rosag_48200 [Roseisolibacter agri]|uniref:Uncharacterized protein n=2 Tax=Roseisolibacter agri TaxID=2014610 RepID=A0AA37QDG0_9BACT|nr:hypothetical protein rosag_48200 [Roseisolibacter agri]
MRHKIVAAWESGGAATASEASGSPRWGTARGVGPCGSARMRACAHARGIRTAIRDPAKRPSMTMDATRTADSADPGPYVSARDDIDAATRLACACLARAFAAALVAPGAWAADASPDVRDAAYACVAALKARGRSPAQVVVAVKHALAGVPLPLGVRIDDIVTSRERVVGWCIAAYFRDD